jgi:hypothetical protein
MRKHGISLSTKFEFEHYYKFKFFFTSIDGTYQAECGELSDDVYRVWVDRYMTYKELVQEFGEDDNDVVITRNIGVEQ